jgi:hypothetical protein
MGVDEQTVDGFTVEILYYGVGKIWGLDLHNGMIFGLLGIHILDFYYFGTLYGTLVRHRKQ